MINILQIFKGKCVVGNNIHYNYPTLYYCVSLLVSVLMTSVPNIKCSNTLEERIWWCWVLCFRFCVFLPRSHGGALLLVFLQDAHSSSSSLTWSLHRPLTELFTFIFIHFSCKIISKLKLLKCKVGFILSFALLVGQNTRF